MHNAKRRFYFAKKSGKEKCQLIATKTTEYDGRVYRAGEEILDLGSLKAKSVDGNTRGYEGLSKDFDKLKAASKTEKYDDLETGSSAFLVDVSEVWKYVQDTREWYKL